MQTFSDARWIRLCATVAWLIGIGAGAAIAAEDSGARVTAVSGNGKLGDSALSQRAAVAEGQAIETDAESHAAVLLKEDVLAELCGNTRLRLERLEGRRIVHVDAGEARIVVNPERVGEVIQIYTPVGIATIEGTVVDVTVDPVTGETTFTSRDHDVGIQYRHEPDQGSATLTAGESTTLTRAGGPMRKQRRRLDTSGTCHLGVDLHQVSITVDRVANEAKVTEKVASIDSDNLPPVGSEGPATEQKLVEAATSEQESPTSETGLIEPIDGTSESEIPELENPSPPPGDPDLGFDDFF